MEWRLLVLEALVRLALARALVAFMPLRLWRDWLGPLQQRPSAASPDPADHCLARAVERASQRLPGTSKCLPQAIALHTMRRRRARPSQLVIAVLPGQARGAIEDLHAWVETGSEVLIGAIDAPFRPLARFGAAN
jgi:hypothetical protein